MKLVYSSFRSRNIVLAFTLAVSWQRTSSRKTKRNTDCYQGLTPRRGSDASEIISEWLQRTLPYKFKRSGVIRFFRKEFAKSE